MLDEGARGDGTDRVATGLAIVFLLSAFAGAVDACGLSVLKDLFVSFMSGNTTSLGVAIGHGDTARALFILSLVGTFVAGAATGTVLAQLVGRAHLPILVVVNALVLAIPIVVPAASIYAMTFAMGALNAAMDHAGSVAVSITYITGTLVKLGRGLGLWLAGRQGDAAWLQQGVPWLGLLSGAIIATLCIVKFGSLTVRLLPVVALTVALVAWLAIPTKTAAA